MNTEQLEQQPKTPEEILYKKGFGTLMNEELAEKKNSDLPDFYTDCTMYEDSEKANQKDQLNFRGHWRRDNQDKEKVYLNSFDIMVKSPDFEGVRVTNISSNTLITAQEAYRMLKYQEKVAVNKNLYNKEGQPYNTWISISKEGELKTYHENYYRKQPFNVRDILKSLSDVVQGLNLPDKLEQVARMLEKAHIVYAKVKQEGTWAAGSLRINPSKGHVDIYDKNNQLMSSEALKSAQQMDPAAADDLKKKPEQNQRWGNNQRNRGMSPR